MVTIFGSTGEQKRVKVGIRKGREKQGKWDSTGTIRPLHVNFVQSWQN